MINLQHLNKNNDYLQHLNKNNDYLQHLNKNNDYLQHLNKNNDYLQHLNKNNDYLQHLIILTIFCRMKFFIWLFAALTLHCPNSFFVGFWDITYSRLLRSTDS